MPDKTQAAAREDIFEGEGGVKIFTRSWRPARAPRGVVAVVHGFNSHSGYYGWVAERLTAQGLAVYALDLRGRGRSEGERFYVESFDDYVSDVAKLVQLAMTREPGLPVFVLGHSAGGVVSCLYAVGHQKELAGLVCSSFAYELPAPDVALAILGGLSHIAPHAHVLALKNETFSRDANVVAAMNSDPLIANEVQPSKTVAAMVRADARLQKELPLITLPVLILHGTLDKDAKLSGSQHFYEAAGSRDKTLKVYEGSVHDLLNDLDKQVVMADIEGWLAAHLPTT
jgi:acylglycerol lipase